MRKQVIIVGTLILGLVPAKATERKDTVLTQPDVPIQIINVDSSRWGGKLDCKIEWRNIGTAPVAGVKFGVLALDLFNEVLLARHAKEDYRRNAVGKGKTAKERWGLSADTAILKG